MAYQRQPCSVATCHQRSTAHGLCHAHLVRQQRYGDPTAGPPLLMRGVDPIIRFMAKVQQEGDCLIWIGSRNPKGYGTFKVGASAVLAHRWNYQQTFGSIADDLDLDHLCRNRACVKPQHLEPVPHAINIIRGMKGYLRQACKRGHPITEENIYVDRDGHRNCRVCKNELARSAREAAARSRRP